MLWDDLSRYDMGESGDAIGISFLNDLPPVTRRRVWPRSAPRQRKFGQFEEMAERSKPSDATYLTIRRTLHRLHAEDIWLYKVTGWLGKS